jgi:PAS domain S-box-containing protein
MEQPPDRFVSERLRFHVKNTFVELDDNDSDDSLEATGDFARAVTEPAKAPDGAAIHGWPPDEPKYIYTQVSSGADLGKREEHQACRSRAPLDGTGDRIQEGLRALEYDPELAPLFESIKRGGAEVALQLYQDEELMQKLSKKMFDASLNNLAGHMAQPPEVDVLSLAKKVFEMDEACVLTATVESIRKLPFSVTLADPSTTDCPLIGCSEAFEQLSGYKQCEVLGKNCRFMNKGSLEPATQQGMRDTVQRGTEFIGVALNIRKNGERFFNLLRLTTIFVQGKRLIVGIQSDVSDVGINVSNPVGVEELQSVANHIFAGNIDACFQMQGRDRSIQQKLPNSDFLRTKYPQQFAEMQSQFVVLKFGDSGNAMVGETLAAEPAQDSMVAFSGCLDSHPSSRFLEEPTACPPAISGSSLNGVPKEELHVTSPRGTGLPPKSLGSVGHPDACGTECIFYFFRNGCKAGADCRFCHEFHQRKNMKKNRRMLRRLAGEAAGSGEELQAITDKDGGVKQTLVQEVADEMTVSTTDSVPISRQTSAELLRFCYGGRWPVDGYVEKLTLVVGQRVSIPVNIDILPELQHMLLQGLTFTVEPMLPQGLMVNGCTGLLSGTPMVAGASCVHTFTAAWPSSVPDAVSSQQGPCASFQLIINVVDLQQFNLSWCSVDSEGTDNLRLTLSLRQ